MTATAASHTPRPDKPLPHQLLSALAQHRMATTSQLHDLLRPNVARQAVSTPLNKLRQKGLVDYTVLPQSNHTRAWYLTGEGARLARDFPALRCRPPYPINSATAASLKTPHTLTVVRTHLAFAADARRLGTSTARGTGLLRYLIPGVRGTGSWPTLSCTTPSSTANTGGSCARSGPGGSVWVPLVGGEPRPWTDL